MTKKYFLMLKTEEKKKPTETKTWKFMERIRFHPESCKWSKKKNQSLKKERKKKQSSLGFQS